jgi:hypothetical protein
MSDQDPVLSMPLDSATDHSHTPAEAPLGRPSVVAWVFWKRASVVRRQCGTVR